jgi:Arylsulfotransferase (ASST)
MLTWVGFRLMAPRALSGQKASPFRIPGSRQVSSRAACGAAAVVVGVAIALAGSACSTATAGPAAASHAPSSAATDRAPPVTVLKQGADNSNGDIFIAPQGIGPEIISTTGQVIWSHLVPLGEVATDFRTQIYQGRPVLTWWQGTGFGGLSSGTDYIYDDRYQQIAEVHAGNGHSADGHEFLITPWNTALILAFTTATANLTSMGGPADQAVIDGVVQEIDIGTGKVLFQWNSAGHVPYRDSHNPLPGSPAIPWDWFHINAVHLDTDGNLLISSRYTWTVYKVNRHTGAIIWELGGKQSTFTLKAAAGQVLDSAGEIFAYQHDPEAIGNDEYTVFDDESDGAGGLLPYSRVVTVKLDLAAKVATLVKSVDQPEGLLATAEGNAQTTRNGDLFVGWGTLPYISEFSPSGQLLFNADLLAGLTYRAYRLPWHPAG